MTRSRKAADDQVQALLHTFAFELPDPNQELFFQCPSTFPLFLKLPLEIRRFIWRETFPETKRVWYSGLIGEAFCCNQLRNVPPLISAHINQESRTETLRQYSRLLPSSAPCDIFAYNIPSSTRKQPPMFWNGERDILSLDMRSPSTSYSMAIRQSSGTLISETDYNRYWKLHFTKHLKSFLASVRTLELCMRDWDNR
jgi:hypothetical protein